VNVYTAKKGDWSIMALLTVTVTAFTAVASLVTIAWYRFWVLARIKREHDDIVRQAALNRWRSAVDLS
jgi:hypothetical protein